MTKPDWCPADVWDRARKWMREPVADIHGNHLMYYLSQDFEPKGVTIIARAILAERDRALEEAAVEAEWPRIAWSSSEYSGAFNDGCNTVAKAIRAIKENP